jgi:GNAT superfamily N-acetyltransferase
MLQRTPQFTSDEVDVALELIDDNLQNPASTYLVLIAADADPQSPTSGVPIGYVCYGLTPMTAHTYDLYWIVTDPARIGQGIGAALQRALEADLLARGGKMIRVETGSRPGYEGTIRFYERTHYALASRIPDFYSDGDDLLTFIRRIAP